MRAYIIRRLLLIPFTLIGITMLVFGMTRVLPGGPMEQAMQRMQAGEGRAGKFGGNQGGGLSKEQMESMRMQLQMNDPWFTGYLRWVGLWEREINARFVQFPEGENEGIALLGYLDETGKAYSRPAVVKRGEGKPAPTADNPAAMTHDAAALVFREKKKQSDSATTTTPPAAPATEEKPKETPVQDGWKVRYGLNQSEKTGEFDPDFTRAVVYQTGRSGLLQGDLGESLHFGDPVGKMITDRMPISLWFGLITLFLTYAISIPLGIVKAIRHRTWMDSSTSVLLFVGYAIPGFVLGTLLLLFFAFRNQWFPISGFTSEGFASMSLMEKAKDILHHTVLPLLCYLIPSFAVTTMMMKNNLMDSLAADYVRTAVAKGVPFGKAVVKHAVRNAVIPICATLGQSITLLVGGSFLIESVFDINGFGYMGFEAAVHRDYPIVMGVLTLSSFLLLLGNILSDIILAVMNPRIRFD